MAPSSPKTFGQLVARYRNQAGLTQKDLAERTGIAERTIQAIETGKIRLPRQYTRQQLVKALNLSPVEQAEIEAVIAKAKAQRSAPINHTPTIPPIDSLAAQVNNVTPILYSRLWRVTPQEVIFLCGALLIGAIALFLLLPEGPQCPPPSSDGVTLYELPCYDGRYLTLTESDLDLCDNALDPPGGKVDPCFSAPSWNDVVSSMWVGPGYSVELHLHSPEHADDARLSFRCNTAVPDFGQLNFPTGDPVDNNVSRVIIRKSDCQ